MSDIENRITGYLCSGGMWNPELAIHDRVRDLLIDCRAEIARLRAEVERLRNGALESRETVSQPSPEGVENRRDGNTGGGTLTDAEREAVESAMDIAEAVGNPYLRNALRGLLARLGGGK